MNRRSAPLILLGLLFLPQAVRAQGVIVEVGRLFSSPDWTTSRVGLAQPISGVVGYTLYGTHAGEAQANSGLWGPGADLTFVRGGRPGPYLAAGGSAAWPRVMVTSSGVPGRPDWVTSSDRQDRSPSAPRVAGESCSTCIIGAVSSSRFGSGWSLADDAPRPSRCHRRLPARYPAVPPRLPYEPLSNDPGFRPTGSS